MLFCFSYSNISFQKCYHNYLTGILAQVSHPPSPSSSLCLLFYKHLQPSAESSSFFWGGKPHNCTESQGYFIGGKIQALPAIWILFISKCWDNKVDLLLPRFFFFFFFTSLNVWDHVTAIYEGWNCYVLPLLPSVTHRCNFAAAGGE